MWGLLLICLLSSDTSHMQGMKDGVSPFYRALSRRDRSLSPRGHDHTRSDAWSPSTRDLNRRSRSPARSGNALKTSLTEHLPTRRPEYTDLSEPSRRPPCRAARVDHSVWPRLLRRLLAIEEPSPAFQDRLLSAVPSGVVGVSPNEAASGVAGDDNRFITKENPHQARVHRGSPLQALLLDHDKSFLSSPLASCGSVPPDPSVFATDDCTELNEIERHTPSVDLYSGFDNAKGMRSTSTMRSQKLASAEDSYGLEKTWFAYHQGLPELAWGESP
jgi:hypothetical protein